jgi:integrase
MLKVGCVSREWAPEMLDERGNQVEPEEQLAYLRVPVNKMQGEFWVPIPIYTADAIAVWERLRPRLQKARIDRKDHKPTDYLFMMRNQLMGENFLNKSLIPLLCKVAGLVDKDGNPLRDAVGKITSHRARSTLATWLRSNGLSLSYIAKLLGHTDLGSLPWYLREDKNQFARTIRKHNPLNRM